MTLQCHRCQSTKGHYSQRPVQKFFFWKNADRGRSITRVNANNSYFDEENANQELN